MDVVGDNSRTLGVRIRCIDLPVPDWGGHGEIWIGIQSGKDVVQRVKLPADSITFEAELRLGNEPGAAPPNFLGPFAQGTVQERFIYVCWGRPSFGGWSGFRRAKLPLTGISWEMVASGAVTGTFVCTDAKGGPTCATVKPDRLTWQ
ncbi:MAG: hypothetical protein JNJ45_02615 [Chthonomonas sp.]|nr:hypothetical protein [Chthonomonas sp.]